MTETLQLKYLLNKYALETDKESVIDVVRLSAPTMQNRYTNFADIYDIPTRNGLKSSSDNSLIVTSVTTSTLRDQDTWGGPVYYTTFEKSRFKEGANGQAYGWGSRNFTQETWGVANDNHMSRYANNILFEQQFDTPKNLTSFSEMASMFLPTLVGRTEDGSLYDILSEYTSKSQFSYNPITQPVYMKKRTVATFIGTDKNGAYRMAWQDVSDHSISSKEKVASAAKITGGINNTYLSEYYTPTIVYDTNAFTTSNSPDMNRSDETVSKAQYTLTLNLSGMDSVRGNSKYTFNNKSDLTDVLKYAKGFWHNSDMVGLANYYLPFSMYLNQVGFVKVKNIDVTDKHVFQSEKISDKFTKSVTDPIKLVGVSDNNGRLAGVKLALDADALVADNSLQVVKNNNTAVSELSEAGISQIKVNKTWVENLIEHKIVDDARLEYPIGGFEMEYNANALYKTNIAVYKSLVNSVYTWTGSLAEYENTKATKDILASISESKDLKVTDSLVSTCWPDRAVVYGEDVNSGGNSGDSDVPADPEDTESGSGNDSSNDISTDTVRPNNVSSGTVGTLTSTGVLYTQVLGKTKWQLSSSKDILVGGMRVSDLYQGNEMYYSTEQVAGLRDTLINAKGKTYQVAALKNINNIVDYNLSTLVKVNKSLVSVWEDTTKTYTPNWGLSHYRTKLSTFGKVASMLYSQNTVALTTENSKVKTTSKEPVGVALVSNRPQVITSEVQGITISTSNQKEQEQNRVFIKANSNRTSGVETATYGKISLRTGQTGIGYTGRLYNSNSNNYELITDEIHNGASLELDKQNININTIANYDFLITDSNIIEKKKNIILPNSSSKQNGAVYIKTSGFTSEIYDKYAEAASAAIRFTSSAARLCEVRNNEQTSLGVHNANLGQIKQTTYERIQLSTTENLTDANSTVLESKVNITAGGYRFKPASTTNAGNPDRIIYKSCSLELSQDDVYVTIGKTVYSMENLFKVLISELGTKFNPVIVSNDQVVTGNRPSGGFSSTTGMSSGVAVAAEDSQPTTTKTEVLWLTTNNSVVLSTSNVSSVLGISSNLTMQNQSFTPKIDKLLSDYTTTEFTYKENDITSTWSSEAPSYPSGGNKHSYPATRNVTLKRKNGILVYDSSIPFKLSTKPYTGYTNSGTGSLGTVPGTPVGVDTNGIFTLKDFNFNGNDWLYMGDVIYRYEGGKLPEVINPNK